MTLSLTNTLGHARSELRPLNSGEVSIYSCGPTVYRHVHVGNLRSFLLPDLLRRSLRRRGLRVRQVMNITDVGHLQDEVGEAGEDRMLLAAEEEGRSAAEIADFYTRAWLDDMAALNIEPADVLPRASDHVPEMIEIIRVLLERGHAYTASTGDVFFDVRSFPAYGRLSGNTLEGLRPAARVQTHPGKRHHADFQLWRAAGPRRVVRFDSPWGEGFPGWHIECSAMSLKHLGERFDIHTGGVDNIFPHHEDEIAQSEACTGHEVVSVWVHGEHLLLGGDKMAKSAGNLFTVSDMRERGIDPLAFRYLCLTARYRAKLNFSEDSLVGAARALDGLRRRAAAWSRTPTVPVGPEAGARALTLDRQFDAALDDDLDLPAALAQAHALASTDLPDSERLRLLTAWDEVFGLDLQRHDAESAGELPPGAAELLEQRERAREARDFARSDVLRADLLGMGVEVTDTPSGQIWRRLVAP